jgi:hypothetical protein
MPRTIRFHLDENCAKDTKSIGEIIQRLIVIWEVYEPEEMAGRVEYL